MSLHTFWAVESCARRFDKRSPNDTGSYPTTWILKCTVVWTSNLAQWQNKSSRVSSDIQGIGRFCSVWNTCTNVKAARRHVHHMNCRIIIPSYNGLGGKWRNVVLSLTPSSYADISAVSWWNSVINTLRTRRFCAIWGLGAYRAVNTLHFGYKNQSAKVL